jgi:predicted deacylase
MPEIIRLNNQSIIRGENRLINFHIARLPTHTYIDLPVHVIRGKEDGPVLLLMAGLHGDEINGIETIRRMIFDEAIKLKRGTVIAIPIVNVYGFLQTSRDLPDGKDLNRCFPGNQNGSLASRVAWFVMHEIIPQIDLGIDYHTGAVNRTNFPQVRCKTDNLTNLELAHAFSAPFILNAEFRDKSIRKEAAKKGKPIIVYEGGEAQRLDETAIIEGIQGTYRVMQHLNMIDDTIKGHPSKLLKQSTWIRAKTGGIYRNFTEAGSFVQKNQVLGVVTDPYGQDEIPVHSRVEGFAIGVNFQSVLNAGDPVVHIGME